MFDLNSFIADCVTKRQESLFKNDIISNTRLLEEKIAGKSFLVIGGAGSIGSAYIKEIVKYAPGALVVVDTNENGLAELTRELRSTNCVQLPDDYVTYPMDYASKVFSKMFTARKGFDYVANFSAHKHVRSEKDIFSIEAMIRNNVINAIGLLDMLCMYPPKAYFCVSTDKAANPVNIMGASKRIMEDVIFAYSDSFPVKTARFANVAFSNGSLPDGFIKRLSKKQPLSAPTDVKRYFVSPQESGQICMLSSILGNNRDIFYPRLSSEQMVSFDTIALDYIRHNGYEPHLCKSEHEAIEFFSINGDSIKNSKEYPVYLSVSDTSGEKPYEEFYTENELINESKYESLGIIVDKEMTSREKVKSLCCELEDLFDSENLDKSVLVEVLQRYLPSFKHIETGKSLDSKM